MEIRFDGKVVLITGGSAGIGLACADLFGTCGAKVAICGTNAAKLERAEASLREKHIEVFAEVCDVSSAASLEAFAEHVEAALGPIDVWISNAGIYHKCGIADLSEEEWNRTMAVNATAVYLGAKIAYRCMKDRGGVILIASSFAVVSPFVGGGAYAASKAAVSSLIRTLAAEFAPYKIRVNGYVPGVIDTDINRDRIREDGDSLRPAIASQTFGMPEDVAWAAAFLASDYARYITGTTLEISGGKLCVQNPESAWSEKEARDRRKGGCQ